MSRSNFKLQLQKDQFEAQQRKLQSQKQNSGVTQSSAIRLPDTSSVLSSGVPGEVFKVQTSLQHPTRYHVQQKQRDQVVNYLSQSAGNTKVVVHKLLQPRHDNFTGPSSAPGTNRLVPSAPASPFEKLHLSTSADQLPTIDRSALSAFNATPLTNLAIYDQNKTSSSCPPEIIPKQEYIVERRRRYNINDRIKELGTLIPRSSDPDMRWNKGSILKAAVDHMRDLQSKVVLASQIEKNHQEMKAVSKRLLLRIQELEIFITSQGLTIPPMQEHQEIVEAVLKPDSHVFTSSEFSKEEEYEVANFPSQTVSNTMLAPALKQERISPSTIPLHPSALPDEQISSSNYQNQPMNQMQHVPDVTTAMQLQYNQGQPGDIVFTTTQDQVSMSDPLMAFSDTGQTFSSLLNQPEEINFDDVMMEEDLTPIRTDIFLSDSIHQP